MSESTQILRDNKAGADKRLAEDYASIKNNPEYATLSPLLRGHIELLKLDADLLSYYVETAVKAIEGVEDHCDRFHRK